MRKSEVKMNGFYVVRWHDGTFTVVKVYYETHRAARGSRARTVKWMTHYRATNLKTGRDCEIKSAAKLRREIDPNSEEFGNWCVRHSVSPDLLREVGALKNGTAEVAR